MPTTALTAAWARIPTPAHPVFEVLLGLPNTVLDVLDGPTAQLVGQLMAAADVDDLVAGHLVWCSTQRGWAILTADPGRLRQVHRDIEIEELPWKPSSSPFTS